MAQQCWYQDEGTVTKVCVVCRKRATFALDTMTERPRCPCIVHQRHIFAPCGLPKFLCEACQEGGWISLSGTGGGDALYNEILNLEIVKGQMLAYDRVRSEETDDDES